MADPLVDLRVFARPAIQAGTTLMLVATVLLVGGFFLLSFRLQAGLGWSATTTGLAFLPVALGTITGAHLAGSLLPRFGPRTVAPTGLLVAAVGLGVATAGTGVAALLIAAMTVVALGLGAALVSATTTALATADHAEAGVLSGLVNSFHELGAGFGAAIFSAVAAASLVAGGPTDGFVRAFGLAAGHRTRRRRRRAAPRPGGTPDRRRPLPALTRAVARDRRRLVGRSRVRRTPFARRRGTAAGRVPGSVDRWAPEPTGRRSRCSCRWSRR